MTTPPEPLRRIRISVASMWQRFHGCDPAYIRDVCHGRCCDAPSRPGGTMVTIHPTEREAIEALGGTVGSDGMLVTDGRCTFKTDASLCQLHGGPSKPFGCIASPFTLSKGDVLIVRNRYRMLVCYAGQHKGDHDAQQWPPAHVAFRASLELIFGLESAGRLIRMIRHVGKPSDQTLRHFLWDMPARSYAILKDNDDAKRKA